jgi:hypothetical protein
MIIGVAISMASLLDEQIISKKFNLKKNNIYSGSINLEV